MLASVSRVAASVDEVIFRQAVRVNLSALYLSVRGVHKRKTVPVRVDHGTL